MMVTEDDFHMLNAVANFLSDSAVASEGRGETGIIAMWNEFEAFIDRAEAAEGMRLRMVNDRPSSGGHHLIERVERELERDQAP